jgi:hypothetical protein|tara:strand:- start:710 stop:889 length:180 start_codon:yes stop_codon:yes gene_type:complete
VIPIYKVLMGVGIPGTVASVVIIFNAMKKKTTKVTFDDIEDDDDDFGGPGEGPYWWYTK